MRVEIDFDVFKALTALRQREADSYNDVLRRLLDLPVADPQESLRDATTQDEIARLLVQGLNDTGRNKVDPVLAALAQSGAWFNNVFFPEGTAFRATYKGSTYYAQIKGGLLVTDDGVVRTSPSDAASAISGTNVNGWRFWHARRPGDSGWTRIDEFKQ